MVKGRKVKARGSGWGRVARVERFMLIRWMVVGRISELISNRAAPMKNFDFALCI